MLELRIRGGESERNLLPSSRNIGLFSKAKLPSAKFIARCISHFDLVWTKICDIRALLLLIDMFNYIYFQYIYEKDFICHKILNNKKFFFFF